MSGASRRQAIAFAAAAAAASALGAVVQPRPRAADEAALALDQLFPAAFGDWRIDPAAAAFVRPAGELERRLYQQLLERTYIDGSGRRVMLSVAYGREQAGGLELHWPEVCYRYGGFSVYGRHVDALSPGAQALQVTRMVAELPARPEPITYWAVLAGERLADANTFRLRRLSHAVRRELADGLLVRISSIDPDANRAFLLQAQFIDAMTRAMPPEIRRRVEGIPSHG